MELYFGHSFGFILCWGGSYSLFRWPDVEIHVTYPCLEGSNHLRLIAPNGDPRIFTLPLESKDTCCPKVLSSLPWHYGDILPHPSWDGTLMESWNKTMLINIIQCGFRIHNQWMYLWLTRSFRLFPEYVLASAPVMHQSDGPLGTGTKTVGRPALLKDWNACKALPCIKSLFLLKPDGVPHPAVPAPYWFYQLCCHFDLIME